jgi:hypothetical protein
VLSVSNDPTKSTIVTVMATNVKCGTAAQFVEYSQASLITLGKGTRVRVWVITDGNLLPLYVYNP